MFVQKKYPKVDYTMTVELTQGDVEKLMQEMETLHAHLRTVLRGGYPACPTLAQLLGTIRQEARIPYGC